MMLLLLFIISLLLLVFFFRTSKEIPDDSSGLNELINLNTILQNINQSAPIITLDTSTSQTVSSSEIQDISQMLVDRINSKSKLKYILNGSSRFTKITDTNGIIKYTGIIFIIGLQPDNYSDITVSVHFTAYKDGSTIVFSELMTPSVNPDTHLGFNWNDPQEVEITNSLHLMEPFSTTSTSVNNTIVKKEITNRNLKSNITLNKGVGKGEKLAKVIPGELPYYRQQTIAPYTNTGLSWNRRSPLYELTHT